MTRDKRKKKSQEEEMATCWRRHFALASHLITPSRRILASPRCCNESSLWPRLSLAARCNFGTATPTLRLRRDQVLLLYRKILKAAAQFPSIKRDSIIRDIKIEFRENATEKDPQKVEEQHANAQRSYSQLLAYCGFDLDDPDWEITTAENPMPQ